MNFRASPVFIEQAASLLQSLQSMNNLFGSQPGSSISSSESAFKTSKSAFSKSTTQSEEDDCEIIFYEPVKKLKSGESTINLAEDCSSVQSYGKKISQSNLLSPQKSLSPSTQPDNSNSVERKSSSNFIESLSGYNSSSSLSEALVEKDAMELDEDDLPYEQLIMEDDVTKELRKLREQVEKMTQKKTPAEDELNQASLLAAQQRAYMQQLSGSNYMQTQMAAMLYNAKMGYLRQMQAQAQAQIQAQALTLLGKRLYEQLEGVQSRNNYIVLDDEQSYENEQMERIVEEKLKSGQKNIFKITKEARKRATKKVFTIIRQKPRVHRKIVIPRRMSLMESINPVEKVKIRKGDIPVLVVVKKDEKPIEVPKKKKEIKKDNDDEYVIKLHVDESDDTEDINETPVGEEFQVKVAPFKENQRMKRELKLVWDPSKATDRNVNSYFQKLETKFGKKIVSEEFALKFYYEHKMNVKKIMAEIEGNKMYFKNFFEMKQKVLRNRVLHNDF